MWKYPILFAIGISMAILLSLFVTGQLRGENKPTLEERLEERVDLLMEFMGNSTRNMVPEEQKATILMRYFLESFEDKEFSDVIGLKEIHDIYLFDIKGEESKVLISKKWAKIEWEGME